MYINWGKLFLYIFYDKRNIIKNIVIVYIDWKYIAGQFANTYEEILTAVDDSEEVETLKVEIDEDLTQGEIQSVLKVDAYLIKKASKNLKKEKTDPFFDINSDCIKNGPENLFHHIACIIRFLLIHNHVTWFFLISTLVPLIKDKLGDKGPAPTIDL